MKTKNTNRKKVTAKTLIQALLENRTFNFWKKGWAKRIIVEWPKGIPLEAFRKDVVKKVGADFMFERSLTNQPTKYKATKTGLKAIK